MSRDKKELEKLLKEYKKKFKPHLLLYEEFRRLLERFKD